MARTGPYPARPGVRDNRPFVAMWRLPERDYAGEPDVSARRRRWAARAVAGAEALVRWHDPARDERASA